MADFTFPSLTTAVEAVNDLTIFQVQSTSLPVIEVSNGTVPIGNQSGTNFGLITSTRPGFLTGRRPQVGQLFPRGVYNK
jgi:hypothetical protein